MNGILTFFHHILLSLLHIFRLERWTTRRGERTDQPDIEEGRLSTNEKATTNFLPYDPEVDEPVIVPTVEASSSGISAHIFLGTLSETRSRSLDAILKSYAWIFPATPSTKDPSPSTEIEITKPARAKLLDLLIQFPLPPSYKTDRETQVSSNFPASGTSLLRRLTKTKKNVRASEEGVGHEVITDAIQNPEPTTRRQDGTSTVWLVNIGRQDADLSETEFDSYADWTHSMRRGARSSICPSNFPLGSESVKKDAEWIAEWRDDMSTVLQGFQEVHKKGEDEDFRQLLAKMSVSTEGYLSSSGSLRDDSGTSGSHVVRWSSKSSGESCLG